MQVSIWWVVAVLVTAFTYDFITFNKNLVGALRIDRTNPKADVYKIEIENLDVLAKRKFIILEVDNDADFSQK